MARRSEPGGKPGGAYEPDWTEEELEAKLKALRGKQHRRAEAILEPGDLDLNHEPIDDNAEGEDANSRAANLAKSLNENCEWEELEQLAKVQIMMDPDNAQQWRNIAKMAAKGRRRQQPWIMRILFWWR